MKKVLLVTPYFSPEGGGLENYAFQIARRLVAQGVEVSAYCHTRLQPEITQLSGVSVHRLKPDLIVSNTPIRFSLAQDLIKAVKAERPDVIHAHTPVPYSVDMAAIASRETSVPLVVTYHSSTLFKDQALFDLLVKLYLPWQRKTLKQAKRIATVTGNTDKELSLWHNKSVVIPPGVDLETFTYQPYPQAEASLLMIAPLSKAYPSKGVDVMLQSMMDVVSRFPNARLDILGEGELTAVYQDQIRTLGLEKSVNLLGKKTYDQMPELFQTHNIVVVPSIKSEGTPTVILEAFACGRPVVGTRIGGIPELVTPGQTGQIVEPRDTIGLANAICALLEQPSLAAQHGQNARRLVEEKYSWDILTQKYLELYHEAV